MLDLPLGMPSQVVWQPDISARGHVHELTAVRARAVLMSRPLMHTACFSCIAAHPLEAGWPLAPANRLPWHTHPWEQHPGEQTHQQGLAKLWRQQCLPSCSPAEFRYPQVHSRCKQCSTGLLTHVHARTAPTRAGWLLVSVGPPASFWSYSRRHTWVWLQQHPLLTP